MDVVWDMILEPGVDPPLPRNVLDQGALTSVRWDTQVSGIEINDAAAQELEEAWRRHLEQLGLSTPSAEAADVDEPTGEEGRVRIRQHKFYERDANLREKKKDQALNKHGKLECEVCGFVFAEVYGKLGERFIECHHTTPVSELGEDHATTLEELALVCANCHQMLHVSGLLPVEELRTMVHERHTTIDQQR